MSHKVIIPVTLLSILFSVSGVNAQVDTLWSKTFGGEGGGGDDVGYSVRQTTDGGYIVLGGTIGWGVPYGTWLLKTNASGDTLWSKTFVGATCELLETTDGGYILVGGYGLIKTNAWGDTLWTRSFGENSSDCCTSIQQTRGGGYIITGYTYSFGAGNGDVWLIKTNASGDTLWTKTFGGIGDDRGCSVKQTTDEGYVIAGAAGSYGGYPGDMWLIRTNTSGDSLWGRTFGGSDFDEGCSVQQTRDGGYIVAGYTSSFGAGGFDVWLVKTNASGDALWTRTFGGISNDEAYSIQETTDGGYIVVGRTSSFGAGGFDVWLIKTGASGDTLWTKTFGGSAFDEGRSVQQTRDGGYIVVGATESFPTANSAVWLIKTTRDASTSIQSGDMVTSNYFLHQNYPNPFNPISEIRYHLPALTISERQAGISEFRHVRLVVYDLLGREVAVLVNEAKEPGTCTVTFDGSNLASGVYFYRLTAGAYVECRKMVLMK